MSDANLAQLDDLIYPNSFLEIGVAIAEEIQVPVSELLSAIRMEMSSIGEPDCFLSGRQFYTMFALLRDVIGPSISIAPYIVKHSPVTRFGPFGLAVLSSKNTGAAVELAVEYWDLVMPSVAVELTESHGSVCLKFDMIVDMGKINSDCLESSMMSWLPFIKSLGRDDGKTKVTFKHRNPGYTNNINEELDYTGEISFGADMNSLRFPTSFLSEPAPGYNEATLRVLQSSLNEKLDQLKGDRKLSKDVSDFSMRFLMSKHRVPQLNEVATQFNLSERTLSRRLQEEGTSLSKLHLNSKLFVAKGLIQNSSLPLKSIAAKVGYSSQANFSKAFTKQFGSSPSNLMKERNGAAQ